MNTTNMVTEHDKDGNKTSAILQVLFLAEAEQSELKLKIKRVISSQAHWDRLEKIRII